MCVRGDACNVDGTSGNIRSRIVRCTMTRPHCLFGQRFEGTGSLARLQLKTKQHVAIQNIYVQVRSMQKHTLTQRGDVGMEHRISSSARVSSNGAPWFSWFRMGGSVFLSIVTGPGVARHSLIFSCHYSVNVLRNSVIRYKMTTQDNPIRQLIRLAT